MKFLEFTVLGTFAQLVLADESKLNAQRLQSFADRVNQAHKEGTLQRESFPLDKPRKTLPVLDSELREYIIHSAFSYCTPEKVRSKECFCPGKLEAASLITNKTMDTQALVAADPKNKLIVVSYRGTATKKNRETNMIDDLVNYPGISGIKVYHGHLLDLLSLQTSSEAAALCLLKDPKYQGYQLHITGFSVGGSVSAISTPMWISFLKRNNLKNKMRLFLYSNPRPGNPAFAKYLEATSIPIVRYTRKGDVVPHMPEQAEGYAQVWAEFFLSNPSSDTQIIKRCANNLLEDPQCSLGDSDLNAKDHLIPFGRPNPPLSTC
ncbi:hypothetical protein DSO57_1036051 [Entomophthora muscae]|uniref:Uncharacterized protein n=1 Tax=Entomophthora muscae TaxID=34485 RepID=A0ACC2SZC6_9FUNG|nr:hypothetical protein DSO57_1036051 [Entomophthora muscae]